MKDGHFKKVMRLATFCTGFLLAGQTMAAEIAAAEPASRVTASDKNYAALFGDAPMEEAKNDPELSNTMKRFIYGEIAEVNQLTLEQRQLVTIVVLATVPNEKLLRKNVEGALHVGVTPLEIREALYQVAPYIGFARVFDALDAANEVFKAQGIELPLPAQGTVTEEDRLEKGLAVQVGIYGGRITKMRASAPEDERFVQDGLSGYCFGDTFTRGTLEIPMRELLTVSALAALGGVEGQLKGHIAGNLTVGNDRQTILSAIATALPYIGFPRTLNAVRCVDEVTNPAK